MTARDEEQGAEGAVLVSDLERLVPDVEDVTATSTSFLVGLSGHHAGKLFKVPLGDSILGRSPRSVVPFDEKAISQKHAQLRQGSDACLLLDLGSTNGIFVNDLRITSSVELHAGDVIRLGRTTLGFLTDAQDQEQHTRALARAGGLHMTATRGLVGAAPPASLAMAAPTANGLDQALDRLTLALGLLRRYGLVLLIGVGAAATVGAATVFVRPPKAMAECKIFLKQQADEQRNGPPLAGGEYFRFASASFVNPELVKETMTGFGLPTDTPAAVLATAGNLFLRPEETGVYVGGFYDTEAELAERFLASHLHNYLEREINKSLRVQTSEVQLLRKQYDQNEATLKATELELQAFKEQHLAGLPEHAAGQFESRTELQGRALELRASLERYTQELALGRRQFAEGDNIVASKVESAQPYEIALVQIRQKLAAAKAKGFTDEHPEVRQLRSEESANVALQKQAVGAEASDLERRGNRAQSALRDHVDQLSVLASTTKTELDLVQGRLGEIEKLASTMPAVEAKFSELSRSLASSQRLHEQLHGQLKAKELKLEFDRASVAGRYELLDAPSAAPVRPAAVALKRAGIGAGVGLVLGALVAALHWLRAYARGRANSVTPSASRAIVPR